jgi:ABC-type branched-subunit amino acid transport system substrate-binding protein
MWSPSTRPALVLPGLMILLLSRAAAGADPSLATSLAREGDRFFGRGDYATAARLYRTLAGQGGAESLSATSWMRWVLSHLLSGQYREAVDLAGRPALPEGSTEGEIIRLAAGAASPVAAGAASPRLSWPESTWTGLASRLVARGEARAAVETARLAVTLDHAPGVPAALAAALAGPPVPASPDLEGLRRYLPLAKSDPLVLWIRRLESQGRGEEAGRLSVLLAESGRSEGTEVATGAPPPPVRPPTGSARLVVGVLVPLTGTYEYFGQRISRGVELAAARSPHSPVEFRVRDTRGDPETAAAEAVRLADEGAVAILGPTSSAEAERVIEVAARRKIPLLSSAAQAQGLPARSPWFFRNCLVLPQQARYLARRAVQDLGLTTFAIMAPADNYGRILSKLFWDEVTALGGRIVREVFYNLDQTDFSKEIKILAGDAQVQTVTEGKEEEEVNYVPPFEAVFIPDTYKRAGLIAPQLSFHDIERGEVVILGGNGFNSPELIRLGEGYVEGSVFLDAYSPADNDPEAAGFTQAYRARHGEEPDGMAAQAYDAAGILLALAADGRADGEAFRQGLAGLSGYPGACGRTSMDADGESVREPVYLTVLKGRIVELSFDTP